MQTAAKLWYLEQFDILKVLSKRELTQMSETALHKHYKKDDPIMFPFNSQKTLYLLKEGAVKIGNYTDNGEENLKYLLSSGTIFGEMALTDGNSNDFAVATENCIVCTLNTDFMQELMMRNRSLNIAMYKLIGLRLRKVEAKLATIIYKDSSTRIIEFLKELVNDFGQMQDNNLVVKNFLTNTEIGKLTFTSRQTVSSVLNKLKRKGCIDYNEKYIKVFDL